MVLIASLGTLAVIQNIIAAVFTPNILQFAVPWAANVVSLGGDVRLTCTQVLTVVVSLAAYAGVMWFAHHTILGKRIRAVASNPFLAEITRLQPQSRLYLSSWRSPRRSLRCPACWCRSISACNPMAASRRC